MNTKNSKAKNFNNESHKIEYAEIPLSKLRYADYQKSLNKALVKRIVAEFDPDRMRPIEVSYRDGCYWVWDGQHRAAGYAALGFSQIPAQVHYGLTYEQEAILFANQQVNVGRVTEVHKWNALVEAKDFATMETIKIANNRGYTINPKDGKSCNNIIAIKGLKNIVKTSGLMGLDEILRITRTCWSGQVDAVSGEMLGGLNAFLRLYKKEPNFSMDQLIRKLQRNSAVSILSKASGYMDMRSKNDRIAKALVFVYNEKRKEELRLPYNFKM